MSILQQLIIITNDLQNHQQLIIFALDTSMSNLSHTHSHQNHLTMRKFVLYLKKISSFYIQLQTYKRQLATFLSSIDYTLPFSYIDLDNKGRVTPKDLQLYLICNKYYVKPADIDRYFKKYNHGKDRLDYQDIVEALVPHSDFIIMAQMTKNITQAMLTQQKNKPKYLSNRNQNKVIQNMVALIVNTQIQYMKTAHIMMDDITSGGHRVGDSLWRVLDVQRDNYLDFIRMKEICQDYSTIITQNQWQGFINWHFGSHKNHLKRDHFMRIFDSLMQNKKYGSQCNYQRFVQQKIVRKTNQSLRMKLIQANQIAVARVNRKSQQYLRKSQSLNGFKKSKNSKNLFGSVKSGYGHGYGEKKLLYSKLGYRNPCNLIKSTQFSDY